MAEFGWTGLCPTIGLFKLLGQARSLDNEVKFQLLKVTPGKPGPDLTGSPATVTILNNKNTSDPDLHRIQSNLSPTFATASIGPNINGPALGKQGSSMIASSSDCQITLLMVEANVYITEEANLEITLSKHRQTTKLAGSLSGYRLI